MSRTPTIARLRSPSLNDLPLSVACGGTSTASHVRLFDSELGATGSDPDVEANGIRPRRESVGSRVRFRKEPVVQYIPSLDEGGAEKGFYLPTPLQRVHDPCRQQKPFEAADSLAKPIEQEWRKLPTLPCTPATPINISGRCHPEHSDEADLDVITSADVGGHRPVGTEEEQREFPSTSSCTHPFDVPAPAPTHCEKPLTTEEAKLRRREASSVRGMLGRVSASETDSGQKSRDVPNRRSLYAHLSHVAGGTGLDHEDPEVVRMRQLLVADVQRSEREKRRAMTYRQRRKDVHKAKIIFCRDTSANRIEFIVTLAQALSKFGAPSHRIESQLAAACRILGLRCTFVHLPTVLFCEFGDRTAPDHENRQCHIVDRKGQLSLGAIHEVHQTYRAVIHDRITAKAGTARLKSLMEAKPIYNTYWRALFAMLLAITICPLAFGGSIIDMWVAGAGALLLFTVQNTLVRRAGTFYANVYNILVTCIISFVARALSNIRDEMFCWTAISSAGIVNILPGYMILSSALELGTKNIVTGGMHMIYALICTLFLGFGLQFGSDLYLFLVPSAHIKTAEQIAEMATVTSYTGYYVMDNSLPNQRTLTGSFTFTNTTALFMQDIINGCYRPPSFPWYQQPLPWHTELVLVPAFAILLSLANMQPYWTWDFPVMIVIALCSYISNRIAGHLIFGHSDIVASVGAFVVGLLGNAYSRVFGGTAFTVMVPGVLFLVPSGLSEAGGIDAEGHGVALGYAMLQVTVGISVGLLMSCAIVYLFGKRKNAAVFTF